MRPRWRRAARCFIEARPGRSYPVLRLACNATTFLVFERCGRNVAVCQLWRVPPGRHPKLIAIKCGNVGAGRPFSKLDRNVSAPLLLSLQWSHCSFSRTPRAQIGSVLRFDALRIEKHSMLAAWACSNVGVGLSFFIEHQAGTFLPCSFIRVQCSCFLAFERCGCNVASFQLGRAPPWKYATSAVVEMRRHWRRATFVFEARHERSYNIHVQCTLLLFLSFLCSNAAVANWPRVQLWRVPPWKDSKSPAGACSNVGAGHAFS